MKKITRYAFAVLIIFSSCQKEETWVRNWSHPTNANDPTGTSASGNIRVYEGESDTQIMSRVRQIDGLSKQEQPILFLCPVVYDLSQNNGNKNTIQPNPIYMLFPHEIQSMSDKWGWDYLYEMRELRDEYGAEGMQMFLDKYLQGDSTLGMKLNKNF